ncbi:MAG: hypothetical protein V8S27_06715 [Lachnospiraceae bacterium]
MAFLFATCVAVASCPTVKVWASEKSESEKTKIGKVWLVVDADVGIKADVSGDVYVTPDGGIRTATASMMFSSSTMAGKSSATRIHRNLRSRSSHRTRKNIICKDWKFGSSP